MASLTLNTVRRIASNSSLGSKLRCQVSSSRGVVTSSRGEILARPEKVQFGKSKIMIAAIPGIYLGAMLAKSGAAWLEENEIFIPDDDDDD